MFALRYNLPDDPVIIMNVLVVPRKSDEAILRLLPSSVNLVGDFAETSTLGFTPDRR